uniref:Uncharacterized protein n=1 Tax=Oryza barthii TaxID=65489 RepID=A0A0D3HB11_9ORYZ
MGVIVRVLVIEYIYEDGYNARTQVIILHLDAMRTYDSYHQVPDWDMDSDSDRHPEYGPSYFSNTAVVSAAGGHDELHPHLFRVVFVSSNATTKRSTAFIYNSATFQRIKVATTEMSSVIDGRQNVLIGQILYWHLISHGIVAFNLDTHELHEILVLADALDNVHEANLSIVVPKNGGASLIAVSGYILQLWTLHNYTLGAST